MGNAEYMGTRNSYIIDPNELELLTSMDRMPNSMSGGGCPAHVYRSSDVEVAVAIVCPTSNVDLADLSFESCPCRLAFTVDSSARAARASKMYCATSTLLSITSDETDEWIIVPCSTESQAIVRLYEFLMLLRRRQVFASVYVGDLPITETRVGEATLYTAVHFSIKPQTIYLDDLDPEDVRELKALEAALRRKKRKGVRKL